MKIALDAMGGDFAPANPVAGAVAALKEYKDVELILVGDEARLNHELKEHGRGSWQDRLSIKHASEVIGMSEGAVEGVRRKKDSSINRAVELIKEGKAEAIVSAGHTGALVACATIKLRTLPGIDRPGLATILPTERNVFLLIDGGANIDAAPEHLVGYAVMGSIYSHEILGYPKPRVAIMSIGSEAGKGNDFTRETYKLLSTTDVINFVGNIEGHALFNDPVEVVVCDGFVGNVVLKTAESLATGIFSWLKHELKKNPLRQAGALMAKEAFMAIRKKTNTEEYGGVPLLGVNGICIKAHGNSTAKAIKNAIRVARESVLQQVNGRIITAMSKLHDHEK
ncbi:MAG: phosphate acyltransferase PlsX [Verrucomicrobia bacterium Tous-C9LFEB]|nr:MAG: phosphate acyltransferase PlsX [Verrucomicrobia bacterium Tous-C9LFEB]